MTTTGYGSAARAEPDVPRRADEDRPAPPLGPWRQDPAVILIICRDLLHRPADRGVQSSRSRQLTRRHQLLGVRPDLRQAAAAARSASAPRCVYSVELAVAHDPDHAGPDAARRSCCCTCATARCAPVVEVITLLPLVFPPVVLVVGVSRRRSPRPADHFTHGPMFHVMHVHPRPDTAAGPGLALRHAGDAVRLPGARCRHPVDRRHTRWSRPRATSAPVGSRRLLRVLMPSLRTAIINASFLCFALVMGEYTIANDPALHPAVPGLAGPAADHLRPGAVGHVAVQPDARRGPPAPDRRPQLAQPHRKEAA